MASGSDDPLPIRMTVSGHTYGWLLAISIVAGGIAYFIRSHYSSRSSGGSGDVPLAQFVPGEAVVGTGQFPEETVVVDAIQHLEGLVAQDSLGERASLQSPDRRARTDAWPPPNTSRQEFDIAEWLLRGGGGSAIRVARHVQLNPTDSPLDRGKLAELETFLSGLFSAASEYRTLAAQAATSDKVRQIEDGRVTPWIPPPRTEEQLRRDAASYMSSRRSRGEDVSMNEAMRRIQDGEVQVLTGPMGAILHNNQFYPAALFSKLPTYDGYFEGLRYIAQQQAVALFCWFVANGYLPNMDTMTTVWRRLEQITSAESYLFESHPQR